MATGAKSLKEYLKKYQSSDVEEKKKKKKKIKREAKGVLVVDEDPVWQKPVDLENDDDEEDETGEEKPMVDEDIEVKRMKKIEQIKARRSYNSIAEDGSGWVSLSSNLTNSVNETSDASPPRRQRIRNDSHSPETEPSSRHAVCNREDTDMSPPRRRRSRNDSLSPEPEEKAHKPQLEDLSPPRRRRYHSPSPEHDRKSSDLSPPRKRRDNDLSPPRRKPSDSRDLKADLSPPRRKRSSNLDISPPRKPRRKSPSPPTNKELKTGLVSGRDISAENLKSKKAEFMRFKEMDPMLTGESAEGVFRDKITGKRISKEEFMNSKKKVDDKPKEIKLEWGKGLAQKREAEAKVQELELEKDKPFARTMDDPDLDGMLKNKLRWGDPMAHLVKKKQYGPTLVDLGDNEKMKKSGFIIPQEIPKHSWIKRGLEAAPNRYGILPGRHWDGVDRSNGYEKQLFKRTSEKTATQREAYLWSVSDM